MGEIDPKSEEIEFVYRSLEGKITYEERNYPYTYIEDGLVNDMDWGIYCLFDSAIHHSNLKRNNISGNYVIDVFAAIEDKSNEEIISELEKWVLCGIGYGEEPYWPTKARLLGVEKEDALTDIRLELVIPSPIRYANIVGYIQNHPDCLDAKTLYALDIYNNLNSNRN